MLDREVADEVRIAASRDLVRLAWSFQATIAQRPTSAEHRARHNPGAAQKILRLHRLAPGPLQFDDAHCAGPARHGETVVEHGPGRAVALGLRGAQDLD